LEKFYAASCIAGIALILCVSLISKPAWSADTPPLIPMEDFFRNPESATFRISPDGQKLAFLKPWENRLNIHVRDITSGAEKRLTSATERDIAGFFWKGSGQIAFSQDKGGDENFHIFLVDILNADIMELTPFVGVKTYVVDDLEEDPRHMLISMNLDNREVFDVYRVDVETGEMFQAARNPGNITGWGTDHDGRLRLAHQTDGTQTSILYRSAEDEPFTTLVTTNFRDEFSPLFFSYDNKNLYVASNIDRDKTAIYEYDPDKNATLRLLYEHPDVDVSSLLSSKKRRVLTGVVHTTDKSRIHFFDHDREELQNALEEKFPDYEVAVTGMDDDEKRVVLAVHSDRSMGTYYLYDRADGKLEKLADMSPWLVEDTLSQMTHVEYKARDGLMIRGYLTLPAGVEPKNLPVVVIPHGGPSSRVTWGYRSEAQFLANRGAAVFQPNFRGSTGYGKAFWQAGFKQWGRDMQNDITDGVKWLIERGIADEKRIAIYGGSYGGYAALAGAAFTPELYACAVDYVGVSNIFTLLESIPPYWKPLIEMEYEMVGDPIKDKALLEEISPIFHADRIKIPLLIAHGTNDPRVKKAESDQIVEAVKASGLDVVYMVKENEGHGFRNEENRFDFYRAMEDFLHKHLGLR
jgi:dipeptidyl aminopeptidase/acylaminoacyl peptidase